MSKQCAALACLVLCTFKAVAMPQEIPVLVLAEPASRQAAQPIVPAIVAVLARESGLSLVVHPYPWRRAQMMAERGEGLLYGAAMTPARQHRFRFTLPLDAVNQWLVSTSAAPNSPLATEPIMLAVPRSAPFDGLYPALDQAARRIAASPRLRAHYIRPSGNAPCEASAAPP